MFSWVFSCYVFLMQPLEKCDNKVLLYFMKATLPEEMQGVITNVGKVITR